MLPVCSSGRRVDSRSPEERGELCLWFRGAGILHQKRGMRNVCDSLVRVYLKPVMSPSKILRGSDCAACRITGRAKTCCMIGPLG